MFIFLCLSAAQTGISSGALSANNSTSDLSATGGSSQQAGNAQNQLGTVSTSNVTASSSPLQTVATSSAPYNTAAAALSNWSVFYNTPNNPPPNSHSTSFLFFLPSTPHAHDETTPPPL